MYKLCVCGGDRGEKCLVYFGRYIAPALTEIYFNTKRDKG